ncbi:hypothetical protein M427DRAFT_40962 [Gonapodya prolifera JEL478]|uniref:Tautomerase cis-CaaD-like domain-containing protein n=1 Tax=Gonapodya prolifera (strain JEL478) TaxID=1344416 RepID=A0A139AXK0_GONPJ|nr:hypothetical protein M427DRAFT_40962 [Gonapodya prolifera JEL478]|eukprot:KXS21439.1 hypothetical protein M427DRAFT_40962 [Gonapodya prolifera JEL478]
MKIALRPVANFAKSSQFREKFPSDVPENCFFGGWKSTTRFVRIVSQHIARSFDSPQMRDKSVEYLESCYAPIIKARGEDVGWELHIEDTPRETWRTNGIVPPWSGTEAEKEWARLNRPAVKA